MIAIRSEVAGWVRNLHDGRVEIMAEGPAEVLKELEARLWRGPRSAEVSGVVVVPVDARNATSFEVRRGPDGYRPHVIFQR